MNDQRRQAILAELTEDDVPPLQPWEFTISDYEQKTRYTYEGSRNILNRKVKDGELEMEPRRSEGNRIINAYWRPRDVPAENETCGREGGGGTDG